MLTSVPGDQIRACRNVIIGARASKRVAMLGCNKQIIIYIVIAQINRDVRARRFGAPYFGWCGDGVRGDGECSLNRDGDRDSLVIRGVAGDNATAKIVAACVVDGG